MARIHQTLQLGSELFPLRLVDGGFWLHRFSRFLLVWLTLTKKIGFQLITQVNNRQELLNYLGPTGVITGGPLTS
jgi:hypothetical protein